MILEFIKAVYNLIASNAAPVSFFGTFFLGGETLALLCFGSAQGAYFLWVVLVFGFLGIVISDIMWYLIGKYSLLHFLKRHHLINKSSRKAKKILHKLYKKKLRLMFFSRFIYGTSIATLVYLGKRMKFKEFIVYEIIISIIWIIIYGGIGWYAGRGVRILLVFYNSLWVVGASITGFALILFLFGWITNKILAREVINE
jgi:membrane protein DedA with SNARE-associated domain